MSTETAIAEALTAGVTALREDRHADAVGHLTDALDGLRDQPELEDFAARAASLLAQAHLACGDPTAARTAVHHAMRILRRHEDQAGLDEVRALDEQIGAALAAEKRERQARTKAEHARTQTVEAIEALATSPLARADALLQHTDALRRLAETERAVHAATRSVFWADEAGSVREQVLGRIALAELRENPAERLEEAARIADAADETTLLGLIAKASELLGIQPTPLPLAGKDVSA